MVPSATPELAPAAPPARVMPATVVALSTQCSSASFVAVVDTGQQSQFDMFTGVSFVTGVPTPVFVTSSPQSC